MADGITIDVKNLNLKGITALKDRIGQIVDDVLDKGARNIETMAKQLAPKNFGGAGLTGVISADNKLYLEKHITANKFYAPFMEFGTGKYAAEEVAKLPADWQQYAATFHGQPKHGTFDDLVLAIVEWIKQKGIDVTEPREAQFDPESGHQIVHRKKRLSKDQRAAAIDTAAYLIARSIVINGVHPHPFMFPSYEHFRPIIIEEVETALKGL